MKNESLITPSKSWSRSFTLIELIVVIIIVGILAAVGISQYEKMVERSRWVEAKQILGDIRKYAYEYRLENGAITGITNDAVNIGGSANQIPSACRSSHYFAYGVWAYYPDPQLYIAATRCTGGGKSPQGKITNLTLWWDMNIATGSVRWDCETNGVDTPGACN